METLDLFLVQYPVDGEQSLHSVQKKLSGFLDEAVSNGAQLVVLPELFVLDLISRKSSEEDPLELERIAEDECPRLLEWIEGESRRRNIGILAGSVPARSAVSGRIRNVSFFFDGEGGTVRQEKLHLTPDEAAWGWEGGDQLHPFQFRSVFCQILICYDIQFAALSSALNARSPELFLCPSMTEAHGLFRVRVATQARAVEHYALAVVTGTTKGPTGSYRSRAAAFTPYDEGFPGILADSTTEQNLMVRLPLGELRRRRPKAGIYSARDSKPFTVR